MLDGENAKCESAKSSENDVHLCFCIYPVKTLLYYPLEEGSIGGWEYIPVAILPSCQHMKTIAL